MVDRVHILIWNRTKKLFAVALSGAGRDEGRETGGRGDITNVQYKSIWNYHNEPPHTMNIS
jgi:hypothetical protein